jgi:hypothetical protein
MLKGAQFGQNDGMIRSAFHLSSSLAAFILIATVPAAAQQSAKPAPPVVATSCPGSITSIELVEHASYDVTFRNTSDVVADDVQLAIPYGRRKVATFDVHATFVPHVDLVQHLHKNLSGGLFAYASDQNSCEVRYVHFVNGTSWGTPQATKYQ